MVLLRRAIQTRRQYRAVSKEPLFHLDCAEVCRDTHGSAVVREPFQSIRRQHQPLTSELLVVARGLPLALLDHLLDRLANFWASGNDLVDSELIEWSRVLDVLERRLEVLELRLDLRCRLLRLCDLPSICSERQCDLPLSSARLSLTALDSKASIAFMCAATS